MNSFQLLKKKFKQISNGIGLLYNEAKIVYKLDKKSTMSRKNHELVINHYNDLKKVGVFIIIQAVPIIGWFPIAFAMFYPRQILTKHFWSSEEYDNFIKQEYEERVIHGKNLKLFIINKNINLEDTLIDSYHHDHR